MKNGIAKIGQVLKKEIVFSAALLLAVLSSLFVPVSTEYFGYLDYRVLALLFCLMFLVAGFRKQGVFHYLGGMLIRHAGNEMQLEMVLVFLCFFFSMMITNDVALITFVPFTIEILGSIHKEKHLIPVIVLQTIAANLGSMLTPIGNPQNLYLYSVSGRSFGTFIRYMLPLTVVSFVFLLGILLGRGWKERAGKLEATGVSMKEESIPMQKKKLILLGILFLVCMGTVLRIVPYGISLLAVVIVGMIAFRELFTQVDYFLLGTFAGFFIFVGNVQRIPAISQWIEATIHGREFWLSIACSQVISNVPATMLLTGFTTEYKELLWGVNIGGLGTLVASLASLISYKFYVATKGAKRGKYMLVFTVYNVIFLVILCLFTTFTGALV